MKPITNEAEELLTAYQADLATPEEIHSPKIQISPVASKLTFVYEKFRNFIDYKEERLIRKNAIKRMLRRRMIIGINAKKIARSLVYELIQARYLENKTIPECRVKNVEKVIEKYIVLINQIFIKKQYYNNNEKAKFIDWIMSHCACEVDDLFTDYAKQEALVRFAYKVLSQTTVWTDEETKEHKDAQIYIAIHRALLKADNEFISYRLLNLYYPQWKTANNDFVVGLSGHFRKIYRNIEAQVNHRSSSQVLRAVKKYIASFTILEKVIAQNVDNLEEVFSDPERLEEKINDICSAEYGDLRKRLTRSSIRAIIYIFLTKIVLALILEVPYDMYVYNYINQIPLAINIIFHPALLFIIALSIRPPKEKNTRKIIESIDKVIYEGEGEAAYNIRAITKRHIVFNVLFHTIYLLTFAISFGLIIVVLERLDFNLASGAFFLLFLTLVSFFGIRNRERAREFIVVGKEEGMRTTLVDFFVIPILHTGQWLSQNFSKVNVFIFVFDFFIDAPFKAFVEIFDDFIAFIKEKKEEITIR